MTLIEKLDKGYTKGLLTKEQYDEWSVLVKNGNLREFWDKVEIARDKLKAEQDKLKAERDKLIEELKTFRVTSWGQTYDVRLITDSYRNNGNLYVGLICRIEEYDNEWWEPYADITVNVGKMEKNCGAIDTNNFPQATEFLEEYQLATFTGRYEFSGYCAYPIYEFDMDKVNRYI